MIGKNDEQAEALLAEIEQLLSPGHGNVPPPPPGAKADGGLMARLNALTPRIKAFSDAADAAGKEAGADLEAKKAALAPRNRLLTLVRDCKGMIGKNDEQAEALLVDIGKFLATANNATPAEPSTDTPTAPTEGEDRFADIEAKWSKARAQVLSKLNAELKWVVSTKDDVHLDP